MGTDSELYMACLLGTDSEIDSAFLWELIVKLTVHTLGGWD